MQPSNLDSQFGRELNLAKDGAQFSRHAAHPRLDALISRARSLAPMRTALVFPANEASLQAALDAVEAGVISVTCFGDAAAIRRLQSDAQSVALKTADLEIVDTGASSTAAAAAAVRACAQGQFDALMKGSLHTDELMAAVLTRDAGLRGAQRMTHCFVFDVPSYHKLLAITDAVINIAPDLQTKVAAVLGAVGLMRQIGVPRPKVAVIAAVETINHDIPATVDAVALSEMARAGAFGNALVEGPFGFDNAISARAAAIKGVATDVAGDPDVLVAPDLNSGNILYKSLVYMAGAECAGLVLGAKVPVILTSRADSSYARLASCALASVSRRLREDSERPTGESEGLTLEIC